MSELKFETLTKPFPRWMGPFSPSVGNRTGFRIHQGRLGAWVTSGDNYRFWPVVDSRGVRYLTHLVINAWGGGRVLFLPNGYVVKPLQSDEDVGKRVLIGRIKGPIVLERTRRSIFDLSQPGSVRPGERWLGPSTTGLSCVIHSDGSLECKWYHPSKFGRDEVSEILRGADQTLAVGFKTARRGVSTGLVRITANGHVITNRQESNGSWSCVYVGYVHPSSWGSWDRWIGRERI